MTHKVYIYNQGQDSHGYHVFTYIGFRHVWTVMEPNGHLVTVHSNSMDLTETVKQYMEATCGHHRDSDHFVERPNGDLEVRITGQPVQFTWTANMTNPVTINWEHIDYPLVSPSHIDPYANSADPSPTTPRRRYLTMMPDSSYTKVASSLSLRDLKFMRVASLRVLRGLNGGVGRNKRSVRMWAGHKQSLIRYGIAIATELRSEGEKDTSLATFQEAAEPGSHSKPTWVYWPRLQKSHQSYLVLRGLRDAYVRKLHTQLEHTPSKGPMEHLRSTGCPPRPRNLSKSDISACLPLNSLINPYSLMYDVEPEENFVYPEA